MAKDGLNYLSIYKNILFRKLVFIKNLYYEITLKEKLFHYASSLSFYNIFSIVPLFLVFFSVLTSIPSFANKIQILKNIVISNILPSSAKSVSLILDEFLLNGRSMGIIGLLVALITSFIFFRSYDDISARIFHSKKRGIFDSFIIYWCLVTLVPLSIAVSFYLGTTYFIGSIVLESRILIFVPFLVTWIIFAILFRISANKPLHFLALSISSFSGALAWIILKYSFFYYMGYNKFYSTIYGSLSIIMFVFLWIYISWFVFLLSMRICKKLDDVFSKKDFTIK